MSLFFTIKSGGIHGQVTLSGETLTRNDESVVGVRFNADGTVDSLLDGSYAQIDNATDWIIPNNAAPGLYQVRVTSVTETDSSGNGWQAAAAANDTWIALTSNRLWAVVAAGPTGADSGGMDFNVEIRFGAGPVVATGAYSLFSEGNP